MAVVINLLRFYTRNLMLTLLLSSMMLRESSMATESSSNTSATTSAGSNNTLTSAEATTTAPTTTLTPTTPIPTCGNATTIDNGHVTVSGTTVNSSATYSCNSGYKLNGNNVTLCQQNGTWQELNATCTLTDCGRPDGIITNGNIIFETTTVNSTATYSCNEGYVLNGTETITCLADGSWSDKQTQCNLRDIAYNGSCDMDGPATQCKTINATCVTDGNATNCLCEEEKFHDSKSDTCKPILGIHPLDENVFTDNDYAPGFETDKPDQNECSNTNAKSHASESETDTPVANTENIKKISGLGTIDDTLPWTSINFYLKSSGREVVTVRDDRNCTPHAVLKCLLYEGIDNISHEDLFKHVLKEIVRT